MTDPTAPPPPSPDFGASQPAFPEPAPLTFPPAEPPAYAPPPAAPPVESTGPAVAPGHWHNPYQATGAPAEAYPGAGRPQAHPPLAGQPVQPHPYQGHQPGHGYAAPGSYGYAPVRRTNGLAIGAMVAALAGVLTICFYGVPGMILGPVGAIMGHVARRRIRHSGEEGDGMALTGIIVGWIVTGLSLLIVAAFVVMFVIAASESGSAVDPAGSF